MSDPGSTYRTRDEISHMRQERDPVERVRKLLTGQGYDTSEMKALEKRIKKEVDTAVEESKVGRKWGATEPVLVLITQRQHATCTCTVELM